MTVVPRMQTQLCLAITAILSYSVDLLFANLVHIYLSCDPHVGHVK